MSDLRDDLFTDRAYRTLTELVYEHSRIRLGSDKQTLLANRLRKRLQVLGLDSYDDYCEVLHSAQGKAEIEELWANGDPNDEYERSGAAWLYDYSDWENSRKTWLV